MANTKRKTKQIEGPVHSEIIDITPTMAMDWLSATPDYQRKIDERQVNKLVMAIQKNEWRLNGAGIVFNEKGDLIDGQHRLTAIYKSGQTVQSLVVTGVGKDDNTFASLGDVKNRSAADFIHTKNANVVASVLRLLWFTENKLLMIGLKAKSSQSGTFPASPPIAEIVKLGKKYAGYIESIVEELRPAMKVTRTGSWVPFLVTYFNLYRSEEELLFVGEFFLRVGDGVGLQPGSPMLLLRKRSLDPTPGLGELPRRVREAITLKAINFYLANEKIERLTWTPEREAFPPLPGYGKEELKLTKKEEPKP